MKVIAVNGSPRKGGNTAVWLQNALKGAETKGAETELINLYELHFKGCVSCFSCKRKGNHCNGICAIKDDLRGVLENILTCDVLLLGSPIYFANITGEMRCFLERLIFPSLPYNIGDRSIFHGKIVSAFIYTMNVTKEQMKQMNYEAIFKQNQMLLELFRGHSEIFICNDTYQFKDYSMYESSKYDEAHKARVKAEQFPIDFQKAFNLGIRLATG
ncbi:Multimeric flavodoxin WrbA [Hathewaya proteolytica DSM 3090]|uniref:Multimeric flavodoxin WrbA n=1 Tax=Hathewaya proteolytica DSM 3090 TaxID=1121331 RepID=A0A1M6N302_9CLOT|nr:flavodoxin family protein [Hathewaya proteolytica]SHJ90008.1 Multimeric flavodoxin WrbA [Hathewaya proteolytica DSM 3090]